MQGIGRFVECLGSAWRVPGEVRGVSGGGGLYWPGGPEQCQALMQPPPPPSPPYAPPSQAGWLHQA